MLVIVRAVLYCAQHDERYHHELDKRGQRSRSSDRPISDGIKRKLRRTWPSARESKQIKRAIHRRSAFGLGGAWTSGYRGRANDRSEHVFARSRRLVAA